MVAIWCVGSPPPINHFRAMKPAASGLAGEGNIFRATLTQSVYDMGTTEIPRRRYFLNVDLHVNEYLMKGREILAIEALRKGLCAVVCAHHSDDDDYHDRSRTQSSMRRVLRCSSDAQRAYGS